ncbi:MAG TPA: fused MFS/spermidine synthase [Gemmatimonadaceae bacterium]|nr:fused MFS/spermidine synthase [Gemmatimonadaceae bacterium]
MLGLFSVTALTSALLIFWVEPLFAKLVLPLGGGSPAVWNTCLMYFQAMLLLGYLYAHLGSKYFSARRQAWIHVALLAIAVLALPIGIPRGWTSPESGNVIGWLVVLLTIGVGAPFFLLAATAPMLQRWLSGTDHPAARNPYMLYAASNAGSLIGLLAFPIILEPNLRLSSQTKLWSAGYVVALLLIAGCAALLKHRSALIDSNSVDMEQVAPTMRDRIRWIALAFAPSSLLLGVTTYLSTDVAAMPLLWVIPLALYLITFIIVFARSKRSTNIPIAVAHAVLVTTLLLILFWDPNFNFRWEYALHLLVFTTTALVLHGELAASRPSNKYLTEFYLLLAFGGALGGAFNALIAPLIFKSILEYQLVVVAACFLRPTVRFLRGASHAEQFPIALIPLIILAASSWLKLGEHHVLGISTAVFISIVAGAVALMLSGNPMRFGVSIAGIAFITFIVQRQQENVLHRDRSFYGAYKVLRDGPANFLIHGTTIHGAQYRDSARHLTPVTYYHPKGPAGQLFTALQGRIPQRRIGVVGLGAGSLLCYSQPGDDWTYFEIDPLVPGISKNPYYFTFLRDCAVRPTIVIGDARLTLAKQADRKFGLLIIDAFSSDAIPVHLLTRQAFSLYERVLDDHGILFVHISNRHLNLQPVVASLANDAGLIALIGEHEATPREEGLELDYSCDWVAIARSPEDFGPLAKDPRWHALLDNGSRAWTDDYSNVWSVIKW